MKRKKLKKQLKPTDNLNRVWIRVQSDVEVESVKELKKEFDKDKK